MAYRVLVAFFGFLVMDVERPMGIECLAELCCNDRIACDCILAGVEAGPLPAGDVLLVGGQSAG